MPDVDMLTIIKAVALWGALCTTAMFAIWGTRDFVYRGGEPTPSRARITMAAIVFVTFSPLIAAGDAVEFVVYALCGIRRRRGV